MGKCDVLKVVCVVLVTLISIESPNKKLIVVTLNSRYFARPVLRDEAWCFLLRKMAFKIICHLA